MTTKVQTMPGTTGPTLFTCLSCSIAFYSADDQRSHYRSDHHRYNMKRRVAGLTPVSAEIFNQKVLERQSQTAVAASSKGSVCSTCGENELKAATSPKASSSSPPSPTTATKTEAGQDVPASSTTPEETKPQQPPNTLTASQKPASLTVDADATEADINRTIDEKIAAARTKLAPTSCLFCPESSRSFEDNLTHMSLVHSFFIPDAEYLVDVMGLITYLGEKIAVGNVCIFCAKEFSTMEAVRKHMADKRHCKIAYEMEDDRLEVSDYYDFTASYPDASDRKKKSKSKKAKVEDGGDGVSESIPEEEEEEWEDVEDEDQDGEADEIVDEESEGPDTSDSDDIDEDPQVTYGDTKFELILPSGAKVGHRTLYRRNHPPQSSALVRKTQPIFAADAESGPALVRKLLADKNSALVPRKGGFGAFGGGLDLVKARNPGEAREAGRHVREFRDQQRREHFKTKVGFKHNNQKHFRDPLLQ
ncbi:hypothetical protein NLI96_g8631 [Meripilus lineatus]|uniref:C2H2-type domain-containing protein n=1 Tax=Meripilus lineatus TaxID=2056292 RepID=A0AAD5UX93_9APHY|nr:hypothetical protein NLI96_g8631 [Physisporinus lineatus]